MNANRTDTAEILGPRVRTLRDKLNEYGKKGATATRKAHKLLKLMVEDRAGMEKANDLS